MFTSLHDALDVRREEGGKLVVALMPRSLARGVRKALAEHGFEAQLIRFSRGFADGGTAVIVPARPEEVASARETIDSVYQSRNRRILHIRPDPPVDDSDYLPPLDMTPQGCDIVILTIDSRTTLE